MVGMVDIRLKTNAVDREVLCDVQKRIYISEVQAKGDEELQKNFKLQQEPGTPVPLGSQPHVQLTELHFGYVWRK